MPESGDKKTERRKFSLRGLGWKETDAGWAPAVHVPKSKTDLQTKTLTLPKAVKRRLARPLRVFQNSELLSRKNGPQVVIPVFAKALGAEKCQCFRRLVRTVSVTGALGVWDT